MPSSPFGKLRLRLLDGVRARLRRPSRIDTVAEVHPTAKILSSSLHGPVVVEEFVTLHRAELSGRIRVGRYSSLWGPGIHVLAGGGHPIEIGAFCSIARQVSVHGYQHDASRISTYFVGRNVLGRPIEEEVESRGPTRIGHDVWLGAGVHVLSGVTIGDGAIVGAGSVVTRDVPAYAVAVGAPARVVRERFAPALAERVRASRWWEWSAEEIRAHEELFTQPLTEALLDAHLGPR